MEEQWTEWRPDDGPGCPVPDGYVFQCEIRLLTGSYLSEVLMMGRDYTREKWLETKNHSKYVEERTGIRLGILRYRLRKPPALVRMEKAVRTVPTRETA